MKNPFQSDGSVTDQGVRMLMECRVPLPSTPDACDIYLCDITEEVTGSVPPEPPITTTRSTTTTTTAVINDNCTFIESANEAIFDTGEPYLNKMRTGIEILDAVSRKSIFIVFII